MVSLGSIDVGVLVGLGVGVFVGAGVFVGPGVGVLVCLGVGVTVELGLASITRLSKLVPHPFVLANVTVVQASIQPMGMVRVAPAGTRSSVAATPTQLKVTVLLVLRGSVPRP